MHFIGYRIDSELLNRALNKYFGTLTYCADTYNIKITGEQPVTFEAINSNAIVIKSITVDCCYVVIEEEFNDYTYEIDRVAAIYLESIQNFLDTYGELLD